MTLSEFLNPDHALFLDFDGTLVDIAPTPEAVVVPPKLLEVLGGLGELLGGALALVSGRPIDQIDGFLQPLRLPVAGVHGTERRRADGSMALLDVQVPQGVERVARTLAQQHPGLQVEVKRGSVALHYRLAPELESLCLATMQAAVDESEGLVLLRGKMVIEAKSQRASKGHAIEAFLAEPPFKGRRPVFIGDDVTDEAGFSTVQALGGIAIKVGEGASVAAHRLDSPAHLREQMQRAVAPGDRARP